MHGAGMVGVAGVVGVVRAPVVDVLAGAAFERGACHAVAAVAAQYAGEVRIEAGAVGRCCGVVVSAGAVQGSDALGVLPGLAVHDGGVGGSGDHSHWSAGAWILRPLRVRRRPNTM